VCRASTDARQAVSLLEIGFVSQNEAGGFVERGGDWDKEIIKWLRLCKFHYCAFREGREVKEFVARTVEQGGRRRVRQAASVNWRTPASSAGLRGWKYLRWDLLERMRLNCQGFGKMTRRIS
jgi:hypothetical protein